MVFGRAKAPKDAGGEYNPEREEAKKNEAKERIEREMERIKEEKAEETYRDEKRVEVAGAAGFKKVYKKEELNIAFRDRLNHSIELNYLPKDKEKQLITQRTPPSFKERTEGQAEYDKGTRAEEMRRLKEEREEKRYEKKYAKIRDEIEKTEGKEGKREKLQEIKRERAEQRKSSPTGQAYKKAKDYVNERVESNKRLLLEFQKQKYEYRAAMIGGDKAGKARQNMARDFLKGRRPHKQYRQVYSKPISLLREDIVDLNPRKEYEVFGQQKEYNLIGENKKYDLGFGSGKKHDLGVGKKYDLGVGGKKLDLFGNGNGKKKKNDKFW